MQDEQFCNEPRSPRRQFLGQLGLIAITATVSPAVGRAESNAGSDWDMSWVDRVSPAPYKAVVDMTKAAESKNHSTRFSRFATHHSRKLSQSGSIERQLAASLGSLLPQPFRSSHSSSARRRPHRTTW